VKGNRELADIGIYCYYYLGVPGLKGDEEDSTRFEITIVPAVMLAQGLMTNQDISK
jgi:hypothetical protein